MATFDKLFGSILTHEVVTKRELEDEIVAHMRVFINFFYVSKYENLSGRVCVTISLTRREVAFWPCTPYIHSQFDETVLPAWVERFIASGKCTCIRGRQTRKRNTRIVFL
jgi:hypothetical protein